MIESTSTIEDLIRSTEQARLRALVDGDTEKAINYHGADFELITPIGAVLTREQYLDAVAAGQINYLSWEPGHIAVRCHSTTATIRYRATLEVEFGGHPIPRTNYWHTDSYEFLDDRWQAVWSQATEIR
ncbi:nuclear transport factor 2 family protein [Cryobacterium sp. TMT4-31]|uniref:nuclear transport factor 2 family protein n=1 Tax=Cryobacterium sp. TMT4-31 TaxID=1259259 RepID=UPI00106B9984|nr:nuclear transport factor 2 family protein [Cryobacterium sp. TMT4-31]TFC90567.1 nuclear transport factor 2 family protein [Cryobacterium sp. TMT4-31]